MLTMAGVIASIQVPPAYSVSEYLFGVSADSIPMSLSLDGGATVLSTGDSLLSTSNNQGWWSTTVGNDDDNDNYIVGELGEPSGKGIYNNFFTFDISGLSSPIVSAALKLQRYIGQSDSGALVHEYHLYDVTTAPDVLNMNVGTSVAIFTDLGSGVSYGTHAISVAGSFGEILMLDLNANAIADLNTAIANRDSWFSIGGTLTPGIVSVPETGGSLILMCSSLLGMILLRVRQRSVETKCRKIFRAMPKFKRSMHIG